MNNPPFLILFLGLDIVLLFLVPTNSCGGKRVTVREIEAAIKRESPLGSTKTEVIAFLDKNRIGHSDLLVANGRTSEYQDDEVKRLINASIPKVKHTFFAEWGIFMSFRFDESDRLVDYRVRWVGTGP